MSKNKSFFQKLSDSLTSLFPFNSTTRENVAEVSFDNKLSPIRSSNRRVASVAFGKDEDESKIKRARLHYDLKSLPTSRIIKPNNTLQEKLNIYNHFNDTASELSEASNISVSTSGVSSLHPRSSKRLYMGNIEETSMNINSKYPKNLNVSQKIISPISNRSFKNAKEFISSPAKKILEKLDKLTTPITAADKLTSLLVKERMVNSSKLSQSVGYSPYGRPIPPIAGKKPLPIKAVTISASSNNNLQNKCGPIRSKHTKRMKRLGYVDDIDLDSESTNTNYDYSNVSNQLNSSKFPPPLKKSISTNTEEINLLRESSPDLEFTFRPPQTVNDEEYLYFPRKDSVNFQFKSKVSEKERNDYEKRVNVNLKSDKLWRCDTCFSENLEESLQCINCGNISRKNSSTLILPKKITEENRESEIKLDVLKSTSISVSSVIDNSSSSLPSSNSHPKIEIVNVNSSTPFGKHVSLEIPLSKNSKFEQVNMANESCSKPLETSSNKISSSDKTSEQFLFGSTVKSAVVSSINTSESISFSPSVDSTNLSSSSKILSFDKTSDSNSLPKQFSLDSTFVSSSIKPLDKTIESNSLPKMFSSGQSIDSTNVSSSKQFGQTSLDKSIISTDSTNQSFAQLSGVDKPNLDFNQSKSTEIKSNAATFVFGKSSNNEVVSSSIPSNKSSTFGIISNAEEKSTTPFFNQTSNTVTNSTLSTTSSFVSSSSNISTFSLGQTNSSEKTMFTCGQSLASSNTSMFSTSSISEKPFTFGQKINSEETSSTKPTPFAFGQKSNNEETTAKPTPFVFGQKSNNEETTAKPTPFAFGQKSNNEETTAKSSPFVFGQKSNNEETIAKSSPFAFGQKSNNEETTAKPTPFAFGQKSNNEETTAKPTPFAFGQKSNNEETTAKPTPFAFGQKLNNEETSSTKPTPFAFGQKSNNEETTAKSSPFAFGQKSNNEETTAKPTPFAFGQKSNNEETTAKSSPFAFGQKSNNEETSSVKPSPFAFGQKSNAEVNSATVTNPKPVLFGQANCDVGKSTTASKFLFGQSSNTEQSSNITQPFTNPGSSLFGGSTSGTAGSLFGNNSVPQSSFPGALFGSQTVTTAAPLATIEPSKPPVASFSFSAQPANVFGAANSNTFGSSFSNTPQMNFSQPAVNQNSSQFPLPNNNNVFGGSQSNPFQFGGSAQAGNSTPFGNSVSNSFGGGLGEQAGFNFNSGQQGLFQFNSGSSSSNLPNMSNAGSAQNPRRTLKSRRKLK